MSAEKTWWNIRAGNGDLLARISAPTEAEAYDIFYATEERRALEQPERKIPDGRLLLGTVH